MDEQTQVKKPEASGQPTSSLDAFFGITARGSSVKTEIIAGVTTFMAMAYILMVNAGMFANIPGVPYGAAYIATAISAIIGTLLMAFLAKMPLAQAPGMGLNAFVVFTLVFGSGLSYANTMVFVLLDGIIFLVLTITGLRKMIFSAIPQEVKAAIPVGIGMFIAFIGFQNGLIVNNDSTLVSLFSFNFLGSATYATIITPLIILLGVILITILAKRNFKGAVLWGILGSAVLYYVMHGIGAVAGIEACKAVFEGISFSNPFTAFSDWGKYSFLAVFKDGFDFSGYLAHNSTFDLILVIITSAFSLCIVDMFDTLGTLYGACSRAELLDENGTPINMEKSMLSDAIATCTGAICGTSTVTTFVESSAGCAAGGKTGMTALVTSICFVIAAFLSPVAQLIPGCATAAALVYVGILMMGGVKSVDWHDPAAALPAFLTIVIMAFGYSISFGIAIGLISCVIVKLFTGKVKEISVATWVLTVIFLAMFFFTN